MAGRNFCVAVAVFGLCGAVTAQPLADSLAEFSGVQGQELWSYGVYRVGGDLDKVYDPLTDFEQFGDGDFTGTVWRSSSDGAMVSAIGGAPGWDEDGAVWAVRRWTAETGGTLLIEGRFGELDTRGGGTICRILVDGVEVFSEAEAGSPRPYSVEVPVSIGSVVDFAIDPGGAAEFDLAQFTAVITAAPCSTDLDANGVIDVFDLLAYLDGWFRGDADFDGNGTTDRFDLAAFVTRWLGSGSDC